MRLDAERLALIVAPLAIFFATVSGPPSFEQIGPIQLLIAAGSLAVFALVVLEKIEAPVVLAFAVVVGVTFRLRMGMPLSSDVFDATTEALAALKSGANPYAHYYLSTNPQGSPFVYLPGELLYYGIQSLIPGALAQFDRYAGILTLLAISSLAPLCGFGLTALAAALYVMDPITVFRSFDGSNDTALALLTVAGVVLLAYALRASRAGEERRAARLHDGSALAIGWAIAFKALSWPMVPFLLLAVAPRRRLRYGAIAAGVLVILALPFAATAPASFFGSISKLDAVHPNVWGFDLWAALVVGHVLDAGQAAAALRFRYAFELLVLAALWRRASTLGVAVMQGAVLVGTALLLAPWSTMSYYAYLLTLLVLVIPLLSLDVEKA